LPVRLSSQVNDYECTDDEIEDEELRNNNINGINMVPSDEASEYSDLYKLFNAVNDQIIPVKQGGTDAFLLTPIFFLHIFVNIFF